VAAKRSPILGYNHNVRYRGVIFHVQTEDSGIQNPHVFTHLFHGGVILSTRKLVYDADAAEDVVRSLMQAQHKAALKDLKNGVFDDKIDHLLSGTPGLLARGAVEDSGPTVMQEDVPPLAMTTPESRAPTLRNAEIAAARVQGVALPALGSARTPVDPAALQRSAGDAALRPAPNVPRAGLPPIPPRAGTSDPAARAPVTSLGTPAAERAAVGAHPTVIGLGAMPPRTPVSSPAEDVADNRGEVSDAFISIVTGPVAAERADDVARVHSAAPPSAPTPPGLVPDRSERTTRREVGLGRDTGAHPTTSPPGRAAPSTSPPRVARPSDAPHTSADLARARTPTPGGPVRVTPARTVGPLGGGRTPTAGPPLGRPSAPPRPQPSTSPPTRSHPPTSPPPVGARPHAPAPQPGRPRPSGTASNVVMSRPAVIIGAPPKVVGGAPAPRGTAPRIRRAREDSEPLFGQDLISEKSLDEVILAYLSEDAGEE